MTFTYFQPSPSDCRDLDSLPQIVAGTDNPFASLCTRPGALPFQFPDSASAESLVAKLEDNNWRAQIVGPHGSGKSTLLAALQAVWEARGMKTRAIALHDGQRYLPAEFFQFSTGHPLLLVVDGYEQLSIFSRMLLRWRCWRNGWGLLITTHAPVAGLPVLITLSPTIELMGQLLDRLLAGREGTFDRQHAELSFRRHGGNLREVWFDLYDRHERTRGGLPGENPHS